MSRFFTNIRNSLPRTYWRRSPTRASSTSATLSQNDISEPRRRYEPGGYHPVTAGAVYNQRYRAVRKLGWGLYSVVWLVEDIQFVFDLLVPWTAL